MNESTQIALYFAAAILCGLATTVGLIPGWIAY